MLFNSFEYVVFLPIVVILYFSLKYGQRWVLLLAASYFFYGYWKVEYLGLIMGSTLVDYISAIKIFESQEKRQRRLWLLASIMTNLGVLFTFKYLGFFSDTMNSLTHYFLGTSPVPLFHLLLPVGISFYTFQTLSYSIDVYLGKIQPERHLGIFAVYVSFFPQLVAGPIERSHHLMPQFREKFDFDVERTIRGLQLVGWGFFKKIVIADRAAIYVNEVYNNLDQHAGVPLIIATYLFALQIYCDFSGYTDIARGSARILGFDLMRNFKSPYFASSIKEFWQRWHISLSTWFRDYVYIPLGGNRGTTPFIIRNIFIVFVVSGLWHGANWTFVIWGAVHGFILIAEYLYSKYVGRNPLPLLAKRIVTFHLVCLAWVFFRANTLTDAIYIFEHAFWSKGTNIVFNGGLNMRELAILIFSVSVLFGLEALSKKVNISKLLGRVGTGGRLVLYYGVIFYLILFATDSSVKEFIYFQF